MDPNQLLDAAKQGEKNESKGKAVESRASSSVIFHMLTVTGLLALVAFMVKHSFL